MPRRSDQPPPDQESLTLVWEPNGSSGPGDDLHPLGEPGRSETIFPATLGCLVASAAADSLGWPTEFMRSRNAVQERFGVATLTDYVAWRKEVGGRFNTYIDYIGPGEYSDDTQLTLAVARSLRHDGTVDQEYFGKSELPRWLDYARGAGRTVIAAARAAARQRTPWHLNSFRAGQVEYWKSGANGAAMRVAPIALANLELDDPPLEEVFRNAIITHGHPRAHVGAIAYVAALHEIGRRRETNEGPDAFLDAVTNRLRAWSPAEAKTDEVKEWLSAAEQDQPGYLDRYRTTVDEFTGMLAMRRDVELRDLMRELGCMDRATRGSGTATVAAAVHLFCRHGGNVERAVVEAVNAIPSDTDTIGAFVGSMAGLYGGYEAIPERWTHRLQDLPYMVALSETLAQIATRETDYPGTLRARPSRLDVNLPDVMEVLKTDQVEVDSRVRHDVLGSGWVKAVHAQETRRHDGSQIIYARVELDIGQRCQFRAYLPPRTR